MSHSLPNKNRALSLVLTALAISAPLTLTDAAMAISLPSSGKKTGLMLPAHDKLEELEADTTSSAGQKSSDFSAIKLGDDKSKEEATPEGVIKTGATVSDFVPKGPQGEGGGGLPAASIKAEAGKGEKDKKYSDAELAKMSVSKKAEAANAMPLPLMDSQEQIGEKAEILENSEKAQIAALWDATLERSPDIQFVVNKLVPTSDKGHATHVMMKLLSTAMYGAIASTSLMTPTPTQGTYMMQNLGASLVQQLNGTVDRKQLAKMSLTQGEIISLYQLVRNTADRLVDQYRCYKKFTVSMDRAATDLEDLRNMAKDAQVGQDAAKQLEMQYTVRKAQRDVEEKAEDVHRHRQALLDLAGAEAISKLDEQIKREIQVLDDSNIPTNDKRQLANPKGDTKKDGLDL